MRQHVIEPGELEIIEILVEYLCKYLQTRQMALLVRHIRRLQISNPPQEMIDRFEEGTATMGSAAQGVKAIVHSDHRDDVLVDDPLLLREFRLRFEIKPPAIDIEDPWAEEPQFDPYTFTLPIQAGPLCAHPMGYFREIAGRKFDGVACDFMDRLPSGCLDRMHIGSVA